MAQEMTPRKLAYILNEIIRIGWKAPAEERHCCIQLIQDGLKSGLEAWAEKKLVYDHGEIHLDGNQLRLDYMKAEDGFRIAIGASDRIIPRKYPVFGPAVAHFLRTEGFESMV